MSDDKGAASLRDEWLTQDICRRNQVSTSGNDYSELKPLGRKIMMHIEKLGADNLPVDGLAVDSITRAIPGAKLDSIQAEIEDLLGEGLLYTTSDSDQ